MAAVKIWSFETNRSQRIGHFNIWLLCVPIIPLKNARCTISPQVFNAAPWFFTRILFVIISGGHHNMELWNIQGPENRPFQYLIVVCANFTPQECLLHHISASFQNHTLIFYTHLICYNIRRPSKYGASNRIGAGESAISMMMIICLIWKECTGSCVCGVRWEKSPGGCLCCVQLLFGCCRQGGLLYLPHNEGHRTKIPTFVLAYGYNGRISWNGTDKFCRGIFKQPITEPKNRTFFLQIQ